MPSAPTAEPPEPSMNTINEESSHLIEINASKKKPTKVHAIYFPKANPAIKWEYWDAEISKWNQKYPV